MIQATTVIEHLRTLGYTQYAGVPCSFLAPFINYVIDTPRLDYVGATSEGEAVGISLGAYLAGRKTVTMCQNSGLGNMVNPLTSLNYPFRVPTLLIVTWRGQPGVKDEPQHEQMGMVMHQLLDTLDIPWLPFPDCEADLRSIMETAETSMTTTQRPFALVMSKDAVEPHQLMQQPPLEHVATQQQHGHSLDPAERLTRTQALEIVLETLYGNEAIIATTGKTARELFTLADRPNHIYIVGGMGTASAIAFGIAHSLPNQPVVVIDGDGSALMKMGNFATIGCYQPANLLHIVFDNEVHDSTGGQSTAARVTHFAGVAAATNYRYAFTASHPNDVRTSLSILRDTPGPSMLHVKIRAGSPTNLGRPTIKPYEVKERFMAFLQRSDSAGSTP